MNFRILLVLTFLEMGRSLFSTSAQAQTAALDPYQALAKREFGTATNELAAIEKEIQDAKPVQFPAIETKLIAVLGTPDATMAGRQFACQMLRLVGSANCVSAVSKLLTDDRLSHSARLVLLSLSVPAADDALRKALASTEGNLRIGVINTLGDRRDPAALKPLATFLNSKDDPTVQATFNAIGKIGGAPAADVLDRAKASAEPLNGYWANAYLRCAGSLAAAGDPKRSLKMFQMLYEGNYPAAIRAGALPALVNAQKEKAVPMILTLLGSADPIMGRAAIAMVISVPGTAASKLFVGALPGLPAESQIVLLGALAARGDAEASGDTVNQLAASGSGEVQLAAIKALARLGNASSVPVLAGTVKRDGPAARQAINAMVELRAPGVTEALMKQSSTGDPSVRTALLNVLAQRGQPEALPAVRQAVNDGDADVRRAGLKALAVLGTQEDFSRLAGMLLAAKENSEQDEIAQTMAAIAGRLKDKDAACSSVVEAIARADAPAKVNLVAVLPSLGGEKALQALRECLAGNGEVRKAAIRALDEWPDAAPLADLLSIAKEDPDSSNQVLALRGYIRMLGLAGGPAAQRTEAYRGAMALATRTEEKKRVLTGLAEVADPNALKLVEPYLEDPELKPEAYAAYEKIAESLIRQDSVAAKAALQRVADQADDRGPRNRAKRALDRMNK